MNFSDRDLVEFRKDVERVRRHEEARRAKQAEAEAAARKANRFSIRKLLPRFFGGMRPSDARSGGEPTKEHSRGAFVARLGGELMEMVHLKSPSMESAERIPEHVVTLLHVIHDEPRFSRWLFALEALPQPHRAEQLARMVSAMRIEDGDSPVAAGFERLKDPHLFKAFCDVLREEGPDACVRT